MSRRISCANCGDGVWRHKAYSIAPHSHRFRHELVCGRCLESLTHGIVSVDRAVRGYRDAA